MHPSLNILTFDIEEWFNLLDLDATREMSAWNSFECRIHENTDRILSLLKDTKCKATFFCLAWVCEKYPEVIRKIAAEGYEIGSHTYSHQLAYELTPVQFREDLRKSIDILATATNRPVRCFRVPGFSITEANRWALDVLAECGITVDSSIFPAGRGHGGFPSFGHAVPVTIATAHGTLREFPINTIPMLGKQVIFSGGGYFRLFPYWLLHASMKRSPYVMTYFHPRDFDARQPVLGNLPVHRRFKSYVGLAGALEKLRKLLQNFKFVDIRDAETLVDWEKAPVVTMQN
jgi:polysaccharide deacetylase family protein (PEP-CTERM system associated)